MGLLVDSINFLQDKGCANNFAWVILPDHVHWLLEVIGEKNISEIMHGFKSYTANQISKLIINQRRGAEASAPRAGNIKIPGGEASLPRPNELFRPRPRVFKIWQTSFYEHIICDEIDFENHYNYIYINPVKHGYVKNSEDWPWMGF